MKMNLLHSAFILTLLPVTSLFSSQQPVSPAVASGALSPKPGAPAEPVDPFADLIAAADASAAQKQVSAAQPAGMPDLFPAAGAKSPEADILLSQAAQHVAALSKPQDRTIKANNAQPAEALSLADFRNKAGDVEGQQAAIDSLKDKKSSAEECESHNSTSLTGAVAGALVGAYEVVRNGVKLVKDSPGRRLLDRLAQCEKEKRNFASASAAQDIALIALGVEDSIKKLKTENLEQMIDGLIKTKAKVDEQSRRALRRYMTEERDSEIETLNTLFNEEINKLLTWYEERRKPVFKKDKYRKASFGFVDCTSDDEDELCAISTETLKQRLYVDGGRKIKVVKVIKKSDKKEKSPLGNDKSDKLVLPAAAKPASPVAVPSPASEAGNL